MQLTDLAKAVSDAGLNVASQKKFVDQLTAKYQAGEKTIRVFVESTNTWSDVNLEQFWTIQQNKLIALMNYQGALQGIQTNLQAALDTAIQALENPPAPAPEATA
ncbi:hypothetical protein Erwinia_phage_Fougasse_00060 [Erwinia phage Fougasse]|nr:hypothetical protein Erwinia_phage_Calisson_00049 [Erwinia phage Calisson]WJN63957.1 hypothetical protein Erwinia_phage_Farigoule_00070 [Erwinia phage Farigoule]WJN64023.1 hypothetical protein Erwinia_phage_Fougasse_00060 [Erwinia phage Fougasse]WJN64115.1 hypothetical protein Erwinia_phage_Mauresque_00073 [Erwinia phage Mauresque]WJN64191.1 hypothetical protein Erwinia_phage_Navette_00071 [Erwinia phage Navette]WJN64256.1 hypothetical protein Erwinia_phage_Nougat_00060 [Erwinia phage Nouga